MNPTPHADPSRADQSKGLVLVVEDERAISDLLRMYLSREGFGVHVATDGPSGLSFARTLHPMAIILDVGLPGMDGKELARLLRRQAATAGARLLALSGYAQAHEQKAARQAGFDHYLVKPVDVQQLRQLLQAEVGARDLGSGSGSGTD